MSEIIRLPVDTIIDSAGCLVLLSTAVAGGKARSLC
jgi:hypothetical protein